MRKLVCHILGHADPVERLATVLHQPAIAYVCPRCQVIVRLISGTRSARRRLRFGR